MYVSYDETDKYIADLLNIDPYSVRKFLSENNHPKDTRFSVIKNRRRIEYKYLGPPLRIADNGDGYDVDGKDEFFECIRLSCCPLWEEFYAVDF
jgi:hypothetical protein